VKPIVVTEDSESVRIISTEISRIVLIGATIVNNVVPVFFCQKDASDDLGGDVDMNAFLVTELEVSLISRFGLFNAPNHVKLTVVADPCEEGGAHSLILVIRKDLVITDAVELVAVQTAPIDDNRPRSVMYELNAALLKNLNL